MGMFTSLDVKLYTVVPGLRAKICIEYQSAGRNTFMIVANFFVAVVVIVKKLYIMVLRPGKAYIFFYNDLQEVGNRTTSDAVSPPL